MYDYGMRNEYEVRYTSQHFSTLRGEW